MFALDVGSIERAIQEVKRYQDDLEAKIQELVEALVDEGELEAKIQVAYMGAIDTGELMQSIQGYYDSSLHCGFVVAGAEYAAFVEYGTGVVGQSNPHPMPIGWTYDMNSHGDSGWTYFSDRDGGFHWTKGVPSKPFMYNTYRHLEQVMTRIAQQVFSGM